MISSTDFTSNVIYKWEGGNNTVIEGDNYKCTIEYGNEKWPDNYIFMIPDSDPESIKFGRNWELVPAGYFGKKPKNLPKKLNYITNVLDTEYNLTVTFEYTVEDGYPVKVRTKRGNIETNITLVWN